MLCAVILTVLIASFSVTAQQAPATLPYRLDEYLKTIVRTSAAEYKLLVDGEPITKLLEADPAQEVAVFGAIWINAPIRRYVEAVEDIEEFERGGGFLITKRISSPPRLEDFSDLKLTEEDIKDLRKCKVGDCEVKLSAPALKRFREEIDWSNRTPHSAVNTLMREILFGYVNRYLKDGNNSLAVYQDAEHPLSVAQEFQTIVDQMPSLSDYTTDIRNYLLNFPNSGSDNMKSFLYWQETKFGLKPTIRINHLAIRQGPDATVVASKMLYATHYFRTALELRALVPDPSRGNGFWFFTVNRSRTDGLSGFLGRLVRIRVRSEVRDGLLAVLKATKRKLEQSR